VAVVYYLTARLGLLQELVRDQVTPCWPPTGVALFALLVFGLRLWPGIALGAFTVNTTIGSSLVAAPIITVGNTLAPLCAYLMLRRVGFRTEIDRRRDALALVFLGALIGMLISSTIGTSAMLLTGGISMDDFWPTWSVWWTGDAMGVLVVTPVLLTIRGLDRRHRRPWHRWVEAAGLFTVTFVVAAVAMWGSYRLTFLVFPCLIWAALRFQLPGSMLCAVFASVMATISATDRIGPFAHLNDVEVMLNLQSFNGAMALTSLLLSAVITEQQNTRRSVERACQELVQVLEHLTAGEAGGRPPPRDAD